MTTYVTENVTDFNKCLDLYNLSRDDIDHTLVQELVNNNLSNTSSSPITCSRIQSFIEELGLSCENATEYDRKLLSIHSREGMNILGIIVFTIAFAIVLGQLGPNGKRIVAVIGVLNEAIMKLVALVMW